MTKCNRVGVSHRMLMCLCAAMAALSLFTWQTLASNATQPTSQPSSRPFASTSGATPHEAQLAKSWCDAAMERGPGEPVRVTCVWQGWGAMQFGETVVGKPLILGGKTYAVGLGTYAPSDIQVVTTSPARRLHALVGVDDVPVARTPLANKVGFSVVSGGKTLWSCPPRGAADGAVEIDIDLAGAKEFHLVAAATPGEDGKIRFANADWIEPVVTLDDGSTNAFAQRTGPGVGAMPPFSFRYDGKPSGEFLKTWQVTRTSQPAIDGVQVHRAVYVDPKTHLECTFELQEYADFPAAKWVLHFKNSGTSDTPILEDIQALDTTLASSLATQLHRSKGGAAHIDDYLYSTQTLAPFYDNEPVRLGATDGRSSSFILPFFNLQDGEAGTMIAVGWTGQWAATFEQTVNAKVRVRAGMEKTHLVVHPGEEIRSPSILMLFWEGQTMRGHNLLRQFILRHNTPQKDGHPIQAPLCAGEWGGSLTKDMLAKVALMRRMQLPYDVFWIDAGWFGDAGGQFLNEDTGHWGRQVGNWNIDKSIHPDAMVEVSKAAREAGYKMLLWVEPERAFAGTQLPREHPDWYLKDPKEPKNLLLNLGNPQARQWATNFVSGLITDLNLSWYRQDFNISTIEEWRANDTPDRQGMTEIRHIEGLYAFWDELLRRHRGLCIDNCSSGGKRIDIETLARSIPLWRSDYANKDPIAGQEHTMGLSYWVPLSGTAAVVLTPESYKFRSNLSACLAYHAGVSGPDDARMIQWHRTMTAHYVRARPLYYGDYYPLTTDTASPSEWAAYQMHRADLNEGMILAFRRAQSPYPTGVFKLGGLEADAKYELEDVDSGKKTVLTGKELSEAMTIIIDDANQSRLLFYRKVK